MRERDRAKRAFPEGGRLQAAPTARACVFVPVRSAEQARLTARNEHAPLSRGGLAEREGLRETRFPAGGGFDRSAAFASLIGFFVRSGAKRSLSERQDEKAALRGGYSIGGERGIRTPVTLSGKHTFQACAFNHSAISPFSRRSSKSEGDFPFELPPEQGGESKQVNDAQAGLNSPHKGSPKRWATRSAESPRPKRNISLVIAASTVMSWALTTPISAKALLVV